MKLTAPASPPRASRPTVASANRGLKRSVGANMSFKRNLWKKAVRSRLKLSSRSRRPYFWARCELGDQPFRADDPAGFESGGFGKAAFRLSVRFVQHCEHVVVMVDKSRISAFPFVRGSRKFLLHQRSLYRGPGLDSIKVRGQWVGNGKAILLGPHEHHE